MVNASGPTADFNRVEVRAKYIGWDATIPTGTVTFTPRVTRAVDTALKTVIVARPITATIAGDGSLTVLLPATDDPDINVSFTYAVVENFPGGDSYDINVPIAAEAAGLDLATVPRTYSVTAPNGQFAVTKAQFDALSTQVAALGTGGTGGGGATLADLRNTDANAFYTSGAYPTRASVTTDTARRVRWIGPVAPVISSTYATNGFDVWEQK